MAIGMKIMSDSIRSNENTYRFDDKNGPFEKQVHKNIEFYGTPEEVKAIIDAASEGLIDPWFAIGVEYDEEIYYSGQEGEAQAYVLGFVAVDEDEAALVRAAIIAKEEAEAERVAEAIRRRKAFKAEQAAAQKRHDEAKKEEARRALANIKKHYPELLD